MTIPGGVLRIHYFLSDFDVLDVAKLDQLAQARESCDRLVVALVADSDLERATGRKPLHPLADRLDLVAQLRGVDQVFPHVAASLPSFAEGDDVRYFVTEPFLTPLLRVPNTVLRPRCTSQSRFLAVLRRSHEDCAPRHLVAS